ncbi:hypothetical protein [Variovorax sp. RA8]|uniref:hypothetical protein n=1 Tax=Variovorax sp. (strain JCM 16519 / RA8) TaxID=662548 RepID=UPI000ABDAB43|nr:hypothetical protein [Variovorax sp. RA8]VTU35502.1 hypothetical protein RA8CHR_05234 [Variovorax sp. RA8]
MEDENSDPVGRHPEEVFADLATEYGLISKGETISLSLWQYTMAIVELCASIGDRYDQTGLNAGEEIRAVYGEP